MELPEDVVFEILLRLPVKSLLRFRCVRKNWCAEINTLHFKEKHLAYRSSPSRNDDDDDHNDKLIFVKRKYHWRHHDDDEIGNKKKKKYIFTYYSDYESVANWKPSYSLDPGMRSARMRSMDVNGVICVINFKDLKYTIVLFNPILRSWRKLPEFEYLPDFIDLQFRSGAIGFGFDEFTKEYLLVQLVYDEFNYDTYDLRCVVYNLSTCSWTVIEIPALVVAKCIFVRDAASIVSSFFSHGSIHWCIGLRPNYCILTFNTTSKLFREIKCPKGWTDFETREPPNLFMIDNSSIAFLASYFGRDGDGVHTLDVWVMTEYSVAESWTKRYSVKSISDYLGKPLCFWRKDKLLVKTRDAKIGCYDLSEGRICQPGQCDSIFLPYSDYESLEVVTCHESLVSIDQILQTRSEKKHLLTGTLST